METMPEDIIQMRIYIANLYCPVFIVTFTHNEDWDRKDACLDREAVVAPAT